MRRPSVRRCVTGLLVLLCAAVQAAPPTAEASLHWAPRSARLTVAEGLPDQTVYSIALDQQGFLWFGTPSGAARYDSRNFQVWRHEAGHEQSLSSNQASQVFVDKSGRLWIGTWGGGLDQIDVARNSVRHWKFRAEDPASLASNHVQTFHQDRQGILWIGTGAGLMRYDPARDRLSRAYTSDEAADALGGRRVWSIAESRDGRLWLATTGGLVEFDPRSGSGRAHRVSMQSAARGNFARLVFVDARDRVWVGGAGEFGRYDPANGRFSPVLLPGGLGSVQPTVNCALALDEQRVWLGTWSGIWLLDTDSGRLQTIGQGRDAQWFAADDVRALLRDAQGQLWAATRYNGVIRSELTAPRFRLYRKELEEFEGGLGSRVVRSIYRDAGEWWLHTDGAMVRFDLDRGRFEPLAASRGLRVGRSGRSVADGAGGIWMATLFGAARLNLADGKLQPMPDVVGKAGVTDANLAFVHRDRHDRLWWGTQREGLVLSDIEGRVLQRVPPGRGRPGDLAGLWANCLLEDRKGRIWLCGENGLSLQESGSEHFRVFRHRPRQAHTLSSNKVTSLLEDSEGTIWIGTDQGLDRWNDAQQRIERMTAGSGPRVPVRAMAEGADDALWLASYGQLQRFDRRAQRLVGAPVELAESGLNFSENAAATLDPQRLLFGTNEGLLLFNPESRAQSEQPPPVAITSVALDRSARPLVAVDGQPQALQVPAGTKAIDLEFAALDFRNPESNQFAYKLEGFDPDWHPPSTRNTATYTNLPPGHYRFRVRAAGADRVWNETGANLAIDVLPPWWQRRDLQGGAAALIVFGLALGVRLHLRQVRRREAELERLVDERSQLVARQQGALAVQDKMASLGTLTAGVAHEINNPTNFAYVGSQNLDADLKRLQDELLQLAGDDAAPEVVAFVGRRFADLHGHVGTIREGAERIRAIVGHLRAFSRLDEAQSKTVSVDEGLASTAALVSTQYGDRLQLVLDLGDTRPIECHPAELNQVFMNLLVNACQAVCSQHGDASQGWVRVRSRDDGAGVRVEVLDNGPGIPAELLPRIFEPFFTTKAVGEGSGLGLSISYGIIERHGGRLEADASPGAGSCLRVWLPRSLPRAAGPD